MHFGSSNMIVEVVSYYNWFSFAGDVTIKNG